MKQENEEMQPKTANILWIHGFGGKANNDTVLEMKRKYPQYDFYSIEVDHHALSSMEKINAYIKTHHTDLVAGTSLGGYYAMCSDFEGPKLVVNPVMEPLRDLKQFLGHNCYKEGRSDGQTDFEFTSEMLAEFSLLKPNNPECVVCHHTSHDQLLGEGIKDEYIKTFKKRKEISDKVLPTHFLTFKYVKKDFGEELMELLDNPPLYERALIGQITNIFEVFVYTDDGGGCPHFHIWDSSTKGKAFHTCVRFDSPEYFYHNGKEDILNSKQKKLLDDFFKAPSRNKRYSSNWEYALSMWNDNNSVMNIAEDLEQPDYTILP